MTNSQYEIKIEEYNKNPIICKNCGKPLILDGTTKLSYINNRKFCCYKCSHEFRTRSKLNNIGIYKIENIVNGKVYIGQSTNIEKRWTDHQWALNSNKHINLYLQNSWNKHGQNNFIFSIIELCAIENLNSREISWIRKLNSCQKEYGYNLTLGGEGSRGLFNTFDVDKQKRIKSIVWDAHRKEVFQYDKNGNFLNKFDSLGDATKTIGIKTRSSISKYCKVEYGLYYGFQWRFYYKDNIGANHSVIDFQSKPKEITNRRATKCKRVYVYDDAFNFLLDYPSVSYASKELNIKSQHISLCCLHKIRHCKNYIFSYEKLTKDEFANLPIYQARPNLKKCKPIIQYDRNHNKIAEFDSIRDAAINYGLSEIRIGECCRKIRKTYKKYIWEFAA